MTDFSSLMDPARLGAAVSNAFRAGVEQRAAYETNKALAEYAKHPSMENAANVARFDPRMAIELQDRESARAAAAAKATQDAQHQADTVAALHGDPAARERLAYFNTDLYLRLAPEQKAQADGIADTIGRTAQAILRLPEQHQAGALHEALHDLRARGVDTSQFKLTGNTRFDLGSALAFSGQLDAFERSHNPAVHPAAPATPAGTLSGASTGSGAPVRVSTPEQARSLPRGTWITLPDNTTGRVP